MASRIQSIEFDLFNLPAVERLLPSRETIGPRSLKHGHIINRTKSPTYASWRNAKTRCFNKTHAKFRLYGARGIVMCPEWASDFRVFLRDMGECPDGLTLERIDVNKGYEPGNCRWATKEDQAKNKTNSLTAVIGGEKVFIKEYVEGLGVSYKSLWWHMKRGRPVEESIGYLLKKKLRRIKPPGGV